MPDKDKAAPASRALSASAFQRVLALRNQEIAAARAIASGDTYSDFFVEGGGEPWHEAFEDVVTGARFRKDFTPARMAHVDRLHAMEGDDYSDFFVEGGGEPWHEAFEDVITADKLMNPRLRARALSTLKVTQAYAKIRGGIEK